MGRGFRGSTQIDRLQKRSALYAFNGAPAAPTASSAGNSQVVFANLGLEGLSAEAPFPVRLMLVTCPDHRHSNFTLFT